MCYGTSRRKEKLNVSLCLSHDIISFFQQIFPNLEKNSTSEINLQKTLFLMIVMIKLISCLYQPIISPEKSKLKTNLFRQLIVAIYQQLC